MADELKTFSAPFEQFDDWYARAQREEPFDHTAVALATADAQGRPSVRYVLLKLHDERGFTFFTHREGRKGRELTANPHAALCFYYPKLEEQIRIEGWVEEITPAESDEYFHSRPRVSQVGAVVSRQSEPLDSRETLLAAVREIEQRYAGGEIPRPEEWVGFRLVPQRFEFWKAGEFRLHDRFEYVPDGTGQGWVHRRLYP